MTIASTAAESVAWGAASGVGDQLGRHRTRQLRPVLKQDLLEAIDIVELLAGRGDVGGINPLSLEIRHAPAIDDHGFAQPGGAIVVAPAANAVEALKRESRRVDLPVTGCARLRRSVIRELLANGLRASDVRIDRRDVLWRRWRRRAENPVHHPRPAQDR